MIKQIWLEKYRPKVLNDVHGNTEIVDSLKVCVEQGKRLNNVGSVPHLILTGPPGVGKTSTVLCMARMLLGDKEKEAVKELNASDERGLEVVREEIKSFAVKKVNLPPNRTKVMILDEADSMTEGAQQALRMIISSNSDSTRFVLCCNDSGKIIDAIQSRCIVMRFSRLSDDDVRMNLKRIIENEKVLISENALKSLLFIADGDMRKAVNNLQACYQFLPNKATDIITEDVVLNICDAPNAALIKEMLIHAYRGNISSAFSIVHGIFREGHSTYDIVNTIYKILLGMQNEIEKQRLLEVLKEVAELKKRVFEGLTNELQVATFLAKTVLMAL